MIINTADTTPDEPFDPRHNITAKELDHDLLNLHLPEADLIATDEECAALYPPGVYQQLLQEIIEENEVPPAAEAP